MFTKAITPLLYAFEVDSFPVVSVEQLPHDAQGLMGRRKATPVACVRKMTGDKSAFEGLK